LPAKYKALSIMMITEKERVIGTEVIPQIEGKVLIKFIGKMRSDTTTIEIHL
jgi:hypothetical protein